MNTSAARRASLRHEFVRHIPERLEEGVLYISVEFATAMHKCFCGCGAEVATPLAPTQWKLIFDGETVSLDPSVGNWSYDCKSHYWIDRDRIVWARRWSEAEIERVRERERQEKEEYFRAKDVQAAFRRRPGPAGER
jgi:hypothetical protein